MPRRQGIVQDDMLLKRATLEDAKTMKTNEGYITRPISRYLEETAPVACFRQAKDIKVSR